ncbi:MAG: copper homeostasis protein CutC [Acidobacteriaceae bacterium]
MPNVLLEVCCGSLDDAIEAERGGAQRVELCSCLFLGGLTPSIGSVIEARRRLKIPIIAMVRPRGGGFCYTQAEFAAMQHDARAMLDAGAEGVVFGILNPDGTIDIERNRVLREIAGSHQSVFHRAIDVTPDPFSALEQLISLGFTRVLTSGQHDSVPEGLDLIRQLIERAGDRIEIMPGGGIKPYAIPEILRVTRCRQLHVAAWKPQHDPSCEGRLQVTFGGALYPPENRYDITDRDVIASVAKAVASGC